MIRNPGRMLAAILGIYLVLSLGRMAAALREETIRSQTIREELDRTERQISELETARNMSDEEVRQWALKQGLAAPEDIVFFDGGVGEAGDRGSSQK